MNEIKKINVGGVDYDIVSESAEKKIAELEKNNTALASVTIGTRNDLGDPIKVGLGTVPDSSEVADIMIGKGTRIGESVQIGSQYPVSMGWDSYGCFFIKSDGGNRGGITIGSNVNIQVGSGSGNAGIKGVVQIDSNSELRMSSAAINIYDTILTLNYDGLCFGTQGGRIGNNISIAMYGDGVALANECRKVCHLFADNCDIYIGSALRDTNTALTVIDRATTVLEIAPGVTIGKGLQPTEHLTIKGPVYLEAESSRTYLTIGTDGNGGLKIDWSGDGSAITFTHVQTGKKATLTLS